MVSEVTYWNGLPIICTIENNVYFITPANPIIKISYVGYHKTQYWAHYYLNCMLMT